MKNNDIKNMVIGNLLVRLYPQTGWSLGFEVRWRTISFNLFKRRLEFWWRV